MPRPSLSKLSNCSNLLPHPKDVASVENIRRKILTVRDSGDTTARPTHALRRLVIESGDDKSVNDDTISGSSLIELGHTKVLCQVIAPTTTTTTAMMTGSGREELHMDHGTLICNVQYAPFGYPVDQLVAASATPVQSSSLSSNDGLTSGQIRSTILGREADLSAQLNLALEAVVPLQHYPKCAIHIQVIILQDDGGILPACMTAASLALVDAAVEVYDLVACCTVAVLHQNNNNNNNSTIFLADPDATELQMADANMTLALLPNFKQVISWSQTGRLSPSDANQAMELCRDGCRTMHRFARQHLVDTHQKLVTN
jgi:ribonuclease PH